jgi:hypothetical protein
MIRRQRSAHARIWSMLAILLPLAVGAILAMAPGPLPERAPIRLDPAAEGTDG